MADSHSKSFKASNGVKQGGVMSPILFTVYIDGLLCRLRNAGFGCYIGTNFCGAFGYADDLVLLAPTVSSIKAMLKICSEFATEFHVCFNPSKSKLIVCSPPGVTARVPSLDFMGGTIDVSRYEKHLGNCIGNISQSEMIRKITNDFVTKVNMVRTHFKWLSVDTLYFLFKQYCMPMYGSQLCDLSSPAIEIFYVAWRKAVRHILNIPYRTHSSLLHLICNDIQISDQMLCRSLKFVKSLVNSQNCITKLCASLAMEGSMSAISNNLSYISTLIGFPRYMLPVYDILQFSHISFHNASNDDIIKASVIRDMLYMRHNVNIISDNVIFNRDQIDIILHNMCTM